MAGRAVDDERRALPGRPRDGGARTAGARTPTTTPTRPTPTSTRRWDSQYPSLWVTDGGGGTFFDIWTPSTFAQAGLLVSNTQTSGRVYEMSSRAPRPPRGAAPRRRELGAPRAADRGGAGRERVRPAARDPGLEPHHDLEPPRLSRDQQRPAVPVGGEADELEGHPLPRTSTATATARCRSTRRCSTTASASGCASASSPGSTCRATRRRPAAARAVARAASRGPRSSGWRAASTTSRAAPSSPAGDFYFVDARWQRIHRWSATERRLTTVADAPLAPVNLAFDAAGNLLVVSYAGNGTVYALPAGDAGRRADARSRRRRPRARPGPHGDPPRGRLAPAARRRAGGRWRARTTTSRPTGARSSRRPRPSWTEPRAGA